MSRGTSIPHSPRTHIDSFAGGGSFPVPARTAPKSSTLRQSQWYASRRAVIPLTALGRAPARAARASGNGPHLGNRTEGPVRSVAAAPVGAMRHPHARSSGKRSGFKPFACSLAGDRPCESVSESLRRGRRIFWHTRPSSGLGTHQPLVPPPPPPPPEKPPPPKELPPPNPVPTAPDDEATGVAPEGRLLVRKAVLNAAS